MKKYIIILIIIFMLYVILYNYSSLLIYSGCEGFTPKVRQTFRPYFRDTKTYCEGFYNNTKNRFNRFLRNIGLF